MFKEIGGSHTALTLPSSSAPAETSMIYAIPNVFLSPPNRKYDSGKALKIKAKIYHMPRKAIRDAFKKHGAEILGALQNPFMRDSAKNLLLALFQLGHIHVVTRIKDDYRHRNLLCQMGKFDATISEHDIIGSFVFKSVNKNRKDTSPTTHIIPLPFIGRDSKLKLPLSANTAGELEKLARQIEQRIPAAPPENVLALEDMQKAVEWMAIKINKETRSQSKHKPAFDALEESMHDGQIKVGDLRRPNHEATHIRKIYAHNKGNDFFRQQQIRPSRAPTRDEPLIKHVL